MLHFVMLETRLLREYGFRAYARVSSVISNFIFSDVVEPSPKVPKSPSSITAAPEVSCDGRQTPSKSQTDRFCQQAFPERFNATTSWVQPQHRPPPTSYGAPSTAAIN